MRPVEVATHVVDDLDRRLGQIDIAIETAAKRSKTCTTLFESQRKAVQRSPVSETRRPAPSLKAERASVAAEGRQIETGGAAIRYVAEMTGTDADPERPSAG